MQLKYFMALLLSFWAGIALSQFSDDFESYTVGSPVTGDWWSHNNCGGGPGCELMVSNEYAFLGSKSGYVTNDSTTDAIADLGNKIFGTWFVQFFLYLPSNKEGVVQFMDYFPASEGTPVLGNLFFNPNLETPNEGYIDNCMGGPISFYFPHDEWFEVFLEVDMSSGISNATCALKIDGNYVLNYGTPFTDAEGNTPNSLGSLEFYSISNDTELYVDNFVLTDDIIICFGIDSKEDEPQITMYPNPGSEKIQLVCQETPEEIILLNSNGQQVLTYSDTREVDVSQLPSGLYFVEVTVNGITGVQRFLKN